ncbi:PepSY-associated TM helix domain-containing protein [Salinicola tamaricis]|uniref:PepSY-associated TM helix domain-containing protein n=1 Tax=Salinicola tamaricis TaxID=1771309 RepID=UPI000D09D1C9|nr:PepSY-associated TM helix domain-containing protein [Salinicola tamaricis]
MSTPTAAAERRRTRQLLLAMITRLHFYVGLLVGPFLLIAALSGIAYALTPQLEQWVYHDALTTQSQGEAQPLARQIAAAQAAAGISQAPAAVRPAPAMGQTTRVMFDDPSVGEFRHRALFIDPVTLAVRGDLPVYGTSGVLPLRTTIDQFHRSLLLGEPGRVYSELAASWLWLLALGGVVLWWQRRGARRAPAASPQRRRQRHATLGIVAALGLVFFSATGLTWSKWAGGNIAELRHAWGWGTPSVSTALEGQSAAAADPHAEHHHAAGGMSMTASGVTGADFDSALAAARHAGLLAGKIELLPPAAPDRAWKVREIGREWPTEVDQVALDPHSFAVLDRTDFSTFPLAAKLTRWGIDLHMGVLFGLPNQLALVAVAGSLATLIFWGYRMWWQRRPASGTRAAPQTLSTLFAQLSWGPRLGVLLVALALGLALPVMGASLVLFVAIDWLRWRVSNAMRLARTA